MNIISRKTKTACRCAVKSGSPVRTSTILGVFAILFALVAPLLVPPVPAAAAQPVINGITPPSGKVGANITVTVTLETNNNQWAIHWDNPTGTILRQDNNMGQSFSATITIPESPRGAHSIYLEEIDATPETSAAATVTVDPAISITPTVGKVGDPITVTGRGWTASESGITVTFDGVAVQSNVASGISGSWTANFTVPASVSGTPHLIDAYSSSTLVSSIDDQTFTVNPSFTMTPTSGPVGTAVTVTGTGFRAAEPGVTVSFDGIAVASNVNVSSVGSFSAPFALPDIPGGSRTVSVVGTYTTNASTVSFNVTPKLTIFPASGATGTPVTITGTGFDANETSITIKFGDTEVKTGITASPLGRWTANFTVPVGAGGTHTVTAGGSSTPATAAPALTFGVSARLSINPTSGKVGATVTATGSSFGANETAINVLYDGQAVTSGVRASPSGDFTATFTVPPSSSGSHRVTAAGVATPVGSASEASFAVSPDLVVAPLTGNVTTAVTITGTGFAASRPVSITWDATALVTTPAAVTTSAQGGITINFAAPRSKGGVHKLVISDGANTINVDWTMESTAPPVPTLSDPEAEATIDYFGDVPADLVWSAVTDPSGVLYHLQVSTKSDFIKLEVDRPAYDKTSLTTQNLSLGTYYWRVKAIDGASNESPWSEVRSFSTGYLSKQTAIGIAAALVIGLGVGIFFIVRRRRLKFPDEKEDKPRKKDKKRQKGGDEDFEAGREPAEAEPEEPSPEEEPEPEPRPVPAKGGRPLGAPAPSKGKLKEPDEKAPRGKLKAEPPPPEPEPPPPPAPDQAEIDGAVVRAVTGLTDADVSLVAQRADLQSLGLNLSRVYKTVSRLEKEGRLTRDAKGKYQPGSGKPTSPEEAPPGKTPEDAAGFAPPKKKTAEEPKPPMKSTIPQPDPQAPGPVQKPGFKPRTPEPVPPPVEAPRPPVSDADTEQAVIEAVIGLTDADIPQAAQDERVRSRGLNLARIYKLTSKLEKDGKLVRDEKGKYQRSGGKVTAKEAAPAAQPEPPAPPPKSGKAPPPEAQFEVPKPAVPARATTPDETDEVVMAAVVGQTDADITQISQLPEIRERGLTLSKLYQISGRLEKTGYLRHDEKGRYQRSSPGASAQAPTPPATLETPPPEPPKAVPSPLTRAELPRPAKPPTGIEWSGKLPWRDWWSFYAKVLSRFLAEETLAVAVTFKVRPEAGISQEKADETQSSLRELGLADRLDFGSPLEKKEGMRRYESLAWTGPLSWHSWENFYAKVLSRFLSEETLSLTVDFKVAPKGGLGQDRIKETQAALDSVGLISPLKLV